VAVKALDVPIDLGTGPPVVLFHGYAMRPATYGDLARALSTQCRVMVPDLFEVPGRWTYEGTLEAVVRTLDLLELDRVSMVAHSFGGGIQLGMASRHPDRVVELVFSDTLGVSREWRLADESMRHPMRLLRLATPLAAGSFVHSWITHPRQLVDAAWWAFTSARQRAADVVAEHGLRAHVLWANRDSVLSRHDGRAFARELGASFTVASGPDRRPLDHDWMFQQPELFVRHLEDLKLEALNP